MRKLKTHFEKVPLEMVMRIMEAEATPGKGTGDPRSAKKRKTHQPALTVAAVERWERTS